MVIAPRILLDSGHNSRVYPSGHGAGVHIGEAAKVAGVTVDTIRFYQGLGLIKSAGRRVAGYRLFDEEQIRDLTFVRHAQALGFSLTEIKELCGRPGEPRPPPAAFRLQTQAEASAPDRARSVVLDRVVRAVKGLATGLVHRSSRHGGALAARKDSGGTGRSFQTDREEQGGLPSVLRFAG